MYFYIFFNLFEVLLGFLIKYSFSTQNHAERFRNCFKKLVLNPKRAKLDQKSDFGNVRTSQTSPGGQVLVSKARFSFFFSLASYTFPFPISKFLIFIRSHVLLTKFISFIKSCVLLSYHFMKSCVLLSNFIIFYKIRCSTKQIHDLYGRQVVIAKPCLYFYLSDFRFFYIVINNSMNFNYV